MDKTDQFIGEAQLPEKDMVLDKLTQFLDDKYNPVYIDVTGVDGVNCYHDLTIVVMKSGHKFSLSTPISEVVDVIQKYNRLR